MADKKKYDFSGYATKVGLKCTDGRTILEDAFVGNNGETVPLVWQHLHNDATNILGHALLENRADGVYAYCSFNDSDAAKAVKEAVKHGDIKALSIYANGLVEKARQVVHGAIREVSLVIAGANAGAYIDNIAFQHGDGEITEDLTEAIISSGDTLLIEGRTERPIMNKKQVYIAHADDEDEDGDVPGETLKDVFNTLSEKQKNVVYALIGTAVAAEAEKTAKHSNTDDYEGEPMKRNVFNQQPAGNEVPEGVLTHDAMKAIAMDAQRNGSLREAFLKHATTYGIENIDFLFPDAKTVGQNPAFLKRDTAWVAEVFGAAHHSPFSRIKSLVADITGEEARARGYVKGKAKVDEVIGLLKRVTTPTTVYKKQKLDRDDVIDITDMDIIAWLKLEMRAMLDEEIARAILVGDGRLISSDDKINESCLRPIYKDVDMFAIKVEIGKTTSVSETIDAIVRARKGYQGSGNPTYFTTPDILGDMLLLKDTTGRRIYNTVTDLAAALRVAKIVEVPVLENVVRTISEGEGALLLGIIVNMQDYYIGADKGGAVNMFDDFDIDFNQYKYLIETRASGALVLPNSALVIEKLVTISG